MSHKINFNSLYIQCIYTDHNGINKNQKIQTNLKYSEVIEHNSKYHIGQKDPQEINKYFEMNDNVNTNITRFEGHRGSP